MIDHVSARVSATHASLVVPRAALALVAAALLAACGSSAPKNLAAPPSMTVTVTSVAARDIRREIVSSGSVAAWQEMSLGVELSGVRVEQVLVEVGSRVVAGQTLLRLDQRTLQVQARQAEASLAQSRASLDLARSSAARGESLLAQKLISTSNFDELRATLSRAEAQLASSEAERDAARLRLGFATLRAPDAGIISARSVQPGQIISVGAELLRLIRRGRLEWRAEVSESDLGRTRIGGVVELTGPDGAKVLGKIRTISPAVDPKSRTALIYADLPSPGSLRAGMFAEGRLVIGAGAVSVVPRESVVFRDGYPYVFVVGADSRVVQRRIVAGTTLSDSVEVRSGLAAGDRIAVRGAGFLSDGDVVRVVTGKAT
jgi:RND family efflux transporter MFP subunit